MNHFGNNIATTFGSLLNGELGPSYKYTGWQVERIIAQSFPISLELGCWAFLVALSIGLPIGIAAALNKGRILDKLLMPISVLGICLPPFVLAPVLLLIFSSLCGWFNPLGWNSASDRILPALTMGTFYVAFIARLMRASLLDVLEKKLYYKRASQRPEPNSYHWTACLA